MNFHARGQLAALRALSTGASRAEKVASVGALIGGLSGGMIGAGAGLLAGNEPGAAIGGIGGALLGGALGHGLSQNHQGSPGTWAVAPNVHFISTGRIQNGNHVGQAIDLNPFLKGVPAEHHPSPNEDLFAWESRLKNTPHGPAASKYIDDALFGHLY